MHAFATLTDALACQTVAAAASEPRPWTPELVLEAIQALEHSGIHPNSNTLVNVRDPATVAAIRKVLKQVTGRDIGGGQLVQMAKQYFDSWPDAIRKAGFDPDALRIAKREFWTDERLIYTLRYLESLGPIHVSYIVRDPHGHVAAALKRLWGRKMTGAAFRRALELRYDDWDGGLRAGGFDPAKIKRAYEWDKDKVLLAIRAFHAHGLDLNANAFNNPRRPPSHGVWIDSPYHRVLERTLGQRVAGWALHGAAQRHFGNWDAALRAAGFDPVVERARMKWEKNLIVSAIKALHKEGIPLNSAYLQRALDERAAGILEATLGRRVSLSALHSAAVAEFHQWDNALRESGLDPQFIRLRFWARGRLSTVPHQREDYKDAQGDRRTQRLVGRREPSPEERLDSREFESALKRAIDGVPAADRPLLMHMLDVIMASEQPATPLVLAQSASRELGTPVSPDKVRELLQYLADSDAMKEFK